MSYTISPFPVYYGWTKTNSDPSIIKLSRPCALEVYVDECGLMRQEVTDMLTIRMQEIYSVDSNIGYLQDGHELCDLYGSDFISFLISEIIREFGEKSLDILEIGSGGGYLAKQLTKLGHRITTIDPSPLSARTAQMFGWNHICDNFPSSKCEQYDLIINMDVWEHVFNPYQFITDVANVMRIGGMHITSVPDCGPSIAIGDHGIFMHQHISYFTEQSIYNMSDKLPCKLKTLERSRVGGSLYVSFITDSSTVSHNKQRLNLNNSDSMSAPCMSRLAIYEKFELAHSAFASYIHRERNHGKKVGLWNPLRAIPYLTGYDAPNEIRLFDHDNSLRGMYPSGWGVSTENTQDLLERPCDTLVILSLSWGAKIAERLKSDGYTGNIKLINEVLQYEEI